MSNEQYVNLEVSKNRTVIEQHIREILRLIGEDVDREGLKDTPARVTRMYEEIFSGYHTDIEKLLSVTFDENHQELVMVKDIAYYSQCEHHMAPFFGKIHIGYLPNGKLLGLSKFARLVDAVTRKLQVQERITSEIADVLTNVLQPQGVIVIVEGVHLCMCARGVRKTGSQTVTSAVRGQFKQNATLRTEFLTLLKSSV
jgi:GTP cyclohydrolase I